MLPAWAAALILVPLGFLSGVVLGRSPVRRTASLALGLAGMTLPFLVEPDPPLYRAFLALGSMLPPLKVTQLWSDADRHGPLFRGWHFISPFDARRTRRIPPRLDARQLLAAVAYGVVGIGSLYVYPHLASLPDAARELSRLALGLVTVYCIVDMGAALVRGGHALAGVDVPPIQQQPVLSRSVAEFWGKRWNHAVSEYLGQIFFMPWARRRQPFIGLLLAFGVSAAVHAWLILVPLQDLWPTLAMGAFFVLQAPILALERRLNVARWQPLPARVWTVLALLGPSPLFVDPMLRLFSR
jgi:hypothetical protein